LPPQRRDPCISPFALAFLFCHPKSNLLLAVAVALPTRQPLRSAVVCFDVVILTLSAAERGRPLYLFFCALAFASSDLKKEERAILNHNFQKHISNPTPPSCTLQLNPCAIA
jgi:hypothetical protein